MLLSKSDGLVTKIKPEVVDEKILLESDVLKSKLAYSVQEDCLMENFIQILINPNMKTNIDLSRNKINIGLTYNQQLQISYLLRVIADANSVRNSCLPLHSSLVQTPQKSLFIFADTNSGKSQSLNALCNVFDYIPIGDDHILFKDNLVVGNEIMRIKDMKSSYFYPIGFKTRKLEDYIIFIVDINKNFSKTQISKEQLIENAKLNNCAMKYLKNSIIVNNERIKIDDFFDENIFNNYKSLFDSFVLNSLQIYSITGSLEKVVYNIGAIVE